METSCHRMHESVLIKEVVDLLVVKQGGIYIDGTVGNGGHTKAIIEKGGPGTFVLGIDRDVSALQRAGKTLGDYSGQVNLAHGNYANMVEIAGKKGIKSIDGVLLDLGVSSDQLEDAGRGFSFMKDGPLDMRMNASGNEETAADLVNELPEEELCRILKEFGEERLAGQIARAIIRDREKEIISTTGRLAAIVERVAGGRHGRIHPATRTFQALRIRVNNEIGSLEKGLENGLSLLAPKGRMAVISFHSLEDRIVKKFFARHAGKWESLQAGGCRWIGDKPVMNILTRRPIGPSDEERDVNSRSRSAKLRVAERNGKD